MVERLLHNPWKTLGLAYAALVVVLTVVRATPEVTALYERFAAWQAVEEGGASYALQDLLREEAHLRSAYEQIPTSRLTLPRITAFAREHGLLLDEVRPHADVQHEYATTTPVTLTMQGRYHDLGRFLVSIEQEGAQVTRMDIERKGSKLSITLGIHITTLREEI